ncbi:MAG: hypothetical protein ABT01_03530 [Clostridium sp. SCN 57-10]|nr:MAG: hypothetical protein ABT01_03530 [Clostridium sp. SCN 57-10]
MGDENIKNKIVIFATAVIIVIMVLVSMGMKGDKPIEAACVLPLVRDVIDTVTLRGTVIEQGRDTVYPNGASRILSVYVKVGDKVARGQTLMRLETVDDRETLSEGVYRDAERSLEEFAQSEDPAGAVASFAAAAAALQPGEPEVYDVKSPINGVVMSLGGSAGDVISGLLPCAAVSDLSKLAVRAQVAENKISQLFVGMPCRVTCEPLCGDTTFSGSVTEITPFAKQTGFLTQDKTIKTDVMISLAYPPATLRPGYSAQARLVVDRHEDALLVPYSAVGQDEEGEYLFAVRGGKAVKVPVQTGLELDKWIEITGDMIQGELIVADVLSVTEGVRVTARVNP